MMKLRPRNGLRIGTGWLPPVWPIINGFIVPFGAAAEYMLMVTLRSSERPGMRPLGFRELDPVGSQFTRWLWLGRLVESRVVLSAPETSPRSMLLRPGPWPAPTGTRLRRSGRAKVVWP